MLYTEGADIEKANFMFSMIENENNTNLIVCHSTKLLRVLKNLTVIPSSLIGNILKKGHELTQEEDPQLLELLALYSTNTNMLLEFSLHIQGTILFPLFF